MVEVEVLMFITNCLYNIQFAFCIDMMPTSIMQGQFQGEQNKTFIGSGTFGKVYKLYQNGKYYALKQISKELIQRYGRRQQLLRQVQIMEMLKHPNIVKFVSFDETHPKYYYLKMQFCEGQNLKDFLSSKRYRQGILVNNQVKFATKISIQYISALVEARSHMAMNRDIKLQNIMLQFLKNGQIQAKMIDFGQVKFYIKQAKTKVGTKGYMAPEIYLFQGNLPYNQSCDCWSLGIILWQLFEGIKQLNTSQKTMCFPFKQNFVVKNQRDFQQLYRKLIFEPILFNTKRTPGPFRKIIKGLLNPDPTQRLSIVQMLQILYNQIDEVVKPFLQTQQIQKLKNMIYDSVIKQKQTIYRRRELQRYVQSINQIYSFILAPFVKAINTDGTQPHFQIVRLLAKIIDKIKKYVVQIMQSMQMTLQFVLEQIINQVMDYQKYCQIQNILVGYQNKYKRQQKMNIDRNIEKIQNQVLKWMNKHFKKEAQQIVQKINTLILI